MSQLRDFASDLEEYSVLIQAILALAVFVLTYLLDRRGRMVARLSAWHQYRGDIRQFADTAITVMSEVEALCEANPEILQGEFWRRRSQALAQLSSLRDQGKLLIPNVMPERYGQEKSSAYRGLRERALDCLAAAFHITTAINFCKCAQNKAPARLNGAQYSSAVDESHWEQMRKIEAGLEKLPGNYPKDGPKGAGWSCKSAMVED